MGEFMKKAENPLPPGSEAFVLPRIQEPFQLEMLHHLLNRVLDARVEIQPPFHIHSTRLIRK